MHRPKIDLIRLRIYEVRTRGQPAVKPDIVYLSDRMGDAFREMHSWYIFRVKLIEICVFRPEISS